MLQVIRERVARYLSTRGTRGGLGGTEPEHSKDVISSKASVAGYSVLALIAAVTIFVHVRYTRTYFFLFDDFAVVGQALTTRVQQIWSSPIIGFYRPMTFTLMRAAGHLFGWSAPGAYLGLLQALHVANAGLVFLLLQRCRISRFGSAVGAVLFLLSPWSSESYFWLSGTFDALATFGVLIALNAIGLLRGPGRWLPALSAAIGLCAAIAALFAKESAVILPGLALLTAVATPPAAKGRTRIFLYWTSLVGAGLFYLLARSQVLPGLNGAYGSIGSLFAHADLSHDAVAAMRAFLTPPLPGLAPGTTCSWTASIAAAAGIIVLTLLAWRASGYLLSMFLLALLVSLTPMLWFKIGSFTSAGGRLLYLPGIWVCGIVALTVDGWRRIPFRSARLRTAVGNFTVAGLLGVGLTSVIHQADRWSLATRLAQTTVRQFSALIDSRTRSVFISNLPCCFVDGPYVLKDYAFAAYFAGHMVPDVRARSMLLEADGTDAAFVAWTDPSGSPEAAPPRAPATPRVLRLILPVQGMPSRVTLEPQKLSVFSTNDASRASSTPVSLTDSDGTQWTIENPAPERLAVEPVSGSGEASLHIVPLRETASVDQTIKIVVRSVTPAPEPLAVLAVRLKTMPQAGSAPPFGFLDLPMLQAVTLPRSGNLVLQGWALDDFGVLRVYGEAVGADGRRVGLGPAVRGGFRADLAARFPDASDLYNAGWSLVVTAEAIGPLPRPVRLNVYAEDVDNRSTLIGFRLVK